MEEVAFPFLVGVAFPFLVGVAYLCLVEKAFHLRLEEVNQNLEVEEVVIHHQVEAEDPCLEEVEYSFKQEAFQVEVEYCQIQLEGVVHSS
jgi:hypothetical protein